MNNQYTAVIQSDGAWWIGWLEEIPGVLRARLELVCCDAGKSILYVGIQEEAGPHFEVQTPPQSDIALPEEIVKDYENFSEAWMEAVLKGGHEADQGDRSSQ